MGGERDTEKEVHKLLASDATKFGNWEHRSPPQIAWAAGEAGPQSHALGSSGFESSILFLSAQL